MPSVKSLELKQAVVSEIKDKCENAKSLVLKKNILSIETLKIHLKQFNLKAMIRGHMKAVLLLPLFWCK